MLFGLTRSTSAADLARGVLEGVALQVVDLIDAADQDTGKPLDVLRVDGGMSRNAWFLQCQANLLGRPVLVALEREATALGAAFLAGLQVGVWPDLDALRKLTQAGQRFEPQMEAAARTRKIALWRRGASVHRLLQRLQLSRYASWRRAARLSRYGLQIDEHGAAVGNFREVVRIRFDHEPLRNET